MRPRWRLIVLAIGVLALGIIPPASPHSTHAQGTGSCETLVQTAFDLLSTACTGLDRNEACVASGPVRFTDETTSVEALSGDVVELSAVRTMQADPLDSEAEAWGMVSISEGAGLPANTEEHVTMWLFGGAELIDRRSAAQRNAPPTATCYGAVTTEALNVRGYPATNASILGGLRRGDTIILTGRLADTSWWRIEYGDQPAWVISGYVRTNCEIIEVPVVRRDAPALNEAERYLDPFQTAALRTEAPAESCSAAPPPGLLLQPPSTGRSHFTLNGVSFELQTSLYVQATLADGLLLQAIEGPITLSLADGWTQEVPPGAQVRFPLSADGLRVTAPPPGLEPLDVDSLAALPLDRLPHPLDRLPRPVIELPLEEGELSGDLVPGDSLTYYFDNRAGIVHELALSSDAFPVLSVFDPERPVLRPYIPGGNLTLDYWTVSDRPHLLRLEAGTSASGTYRLSVQTRDLRLCRPGGNRQSSTLPGGDDHAGNIWFGREGEVVTLRASGDIALSASSFANWRFRIARMFLETPTLPPVQVELLEGHNASTITWTVPETGYYWIEVWTRARGTTTVSSECADR